MYIIYENYNFTHWRIKYNLKLIGFLDVCSLRLDFETLTILGPATTGEADTTGAPAPGHLCQDSFTVTVRQKLYLFSS